MVKKSLPYKFHNALDLLVQKLIAGGLVLITAWSVWRFFACQKRRATADEEALSPAPGVSIPWDAIRLVDNTRWQKSGIVTVTYTDSAGQEDSAVLDSYNLDNLRPILQELAIRAHKAEFVPPPEASGPTSDTSS